MLPGPVLDLMRSNTALRAFNTHADTSWASESLLEHTASSSMSLKQSAAISVWWIFTLEDSRRSELRDELSVSDSTIWESIDVFALGRLEWWLRSRFAILLSWRLLSQGRNRFCPFCSRALSWLRLISWFARAWKGHCQTLKMKNKFKNTWWTV